MIEFHFHEKCFACQELLADAQDLTDLREAVRAEGDAPSIDLPELKRQLATTD